MMQGITMNELYELISHCHDAEFEYGGTTYVLQPEVNDNKPYLVIWDCTPDAAKCIAKHDIEVEGDIPVSYTHLYVIQDGDVVVFRFNV